MTNLDSHIIRLLNDDVLSQIFLIHREAVWKQLEEAGEIRNRLEEHSSWVPGIAHVCRRWRDLAIRSPLLWDDIPLTSGHCVTTYLDRCDRMPLAVRGEIREQDSTSHIFRTLGTALVRAHRIRVLELYFHVSIQLDFLGMELLSFPQLTSLTLAVEGGESFPLPEVNPLSRILNTLPPPPHLVELRLSGVPFFVAQYFFSTRLRVFGLTNFHDLDFQEFTEEEAFVRFLMALSDMPLLETLLLRTGIPTASRRDHESEISTLPFVLALPRLQRLDLRDSGPEIARFLNHTSFPSDAQVALEITAEGTSTLGVDLMSITSKLLSPSDGLEQREIVTMAWMVGVQVEEDVQVVIETLPLSVSVRSRRGRGDQSPKDVRSFSIYFRGFTVRQVVEAFDIDFRSVTKLSVGTGAVYNVPPAPLAEDLLRLFCESIYDLRVLTVGKGFIQSLPAVLSDCEVRAPVCDFAIAEMELLDILEDEDWIGSPSFVELSASCRRRLEAGYSLKTLRIAVCPPVNRPGDAERVRRAFEGCVEDVYLVEGVEEAEWLRETATLKR